MLSDPLPDQLNLRVANAQSRFGCPAIAELITRPGRVVGIHCPSVFTSHDVNVSASSMNKARIEFDNEVTSPNVGRREPMAHFR